MAVWSPWKNGMFGLVGAALLAGCAATTAPLAGPIPTTAAVSPTSPASTQPAPPRSGWPSAQNATTPDRITPEAGGGCVNPVAFASGDPQRDLELKLSGPRSMKVGDELVSNAIEFSRSPHDGPKTACDAAYAGKKRGTAGARTALYP